MEALLAAAAESPPCGPNLEFDLKFFELEEAARGKPEQRVGDVVKPGEDPDWPRVLELGQSLLLQSKDLRIAVQMTRALTRTQGTAGLAAGLGLVHGLLDRYWDGVHPLLEADQANDPTERLNALAPLVDPETLIRDLRDTELVGSREHGRLEAREVEIALGRLAASHAAGAAPVKSLGQIHAQIAAAFASDRTVPQGLGEARDRAQAIQALLMDRVGAERALDLKPLLQSLESLVEACEVGLGTGVETGRGGGEHSAASNVASAGPGAVAAGGEITSREQALRALELVCIYLERTEPTNPAPLFIRRAQRLMTKSFVEIVKDLLPDSLSSLERLAGEPQAPSQNP